MSQGLLPMIPSAAAERADRHTASGCLTGPSSSGASWCPQEHVVPPEPSEDPVHPPVGLFHWCWGHSGSFAHGSKQGNLNHFISIEAHRGPLHLWMSFTASHRRHP